MPDRKIYLKMSGNLFAIQKIIYLYNLNPEYELEKGSYKVAVKLWIFLGTIL